MPGGARYLAYSAARSAFEADEIAKGTMKETVPTRFGTTSETNFLNGSAS